MSDDDRPDILTAGVAARTPTLAARRAEPPPPGQPQAQEAPAAARVLPLVLLAGHLDRLRDDDGRRAATCRTSRARRSSRRRATRCSSTASDSRSAILDRATATASSSRTTTSRRSCATRSSRSRTSASTRTSGVDVRGIGARLRPGRRQRRPASRAARRSRSSSSRTRSRRRTSARVFQKLREAALAYHLTRKWSKKQDPARVPELDLLRQRRLRHRVGGARLLRLGPQPLRLRHAPAALRQGADARRGGAAGRRRREPLRVRPRRPPGGRARRAATSSSAKMLEQDKITRQEFDDACGRRCPRRSCRRRSPRRLRTSRPGSASSSSRSSARGAPSRAGCSVKTTLDLDLQGAAQTAISQTLGGAGPAAAMVVIDNATGEVRALVGGTDYRNKPFNLATQGQRQPGSTVKPFILASALKRGIGLGSVWESRKRVFDVPNGGSEKLRRQQLRGRLRRRANARGGAHRLDNAVYAAAGLQVGTKRISRLIERMGVRTSVSTNPAMTLGAFKQGVSVLDWAHAYESFATGGKLGPRLARRAERGPGRDPRGQEGDADGNMLARNERRARRVLPALIRRADDGTDADGCERRHRQARGLRRIRGRQDRDHGGLRGRVFRRLHAPVHDRRLGQVPGRDDAHEDRVRRRTRRRRHHTRRWSGATSCFRPRRSSNSARRSERATTRQTAIPATRARHSWSVATTPPRRRRTRPVTGKGDGTGSDGKGQSRTREGRGDPGARRHARIRRHRHRLRPSPRRPRSPTAGLRRRQRPAGLTTAARRARRAAARPGGSGRETCGLAASQKRHGSSTACVMPIRVPTTFSGASAPAARSGSARPGGSCRCGRAKAPAPG